MENKEADLRLTALEKRMAKCENKVEAIEVKHNDLQIKLVEIESSLRSLNKNVEKINESNSWILKLLVGGIISAIIAFMISGGFAVK